MDRVEINNYWQKYLEVMTTEIEGFNQLLTEPTRRNFYDILDYNEELERDGEGYLFTAEDGTQIGLYCGCTRAVFVSDDCDAVAKITFLNQDNRLGRDYHGDDKLDQDYIDSEIECHYGNLDDLTDECAWAVRRSHIDYCATEVRIYNKAKEEGLEDFFAETWLMGDFDFVDTYGDQDSVRVYCMAKCEMDEDNIYDSTYNYMFRQFCDENGVDETNTEEVDTARSNFYCDVDGEDVFDFALGEWSDNDQYGADRIADFVDEMSISDLHCGNWGYRNGSLVMCDYASYRQIAGIMLK